jgi:Tfp pilus assembly major pilin PilA
MRNRQQGVTLFSFIMICAVVVVVAILGFKIVPAYVEQYTISGMLRNIAGNRDLAKATAADVRAAFRRQMEVDRITAVGPGDLEVSREDGQLVIEVQYQVTIPMFSNISLLVDFKASSR